jgi:DNA end-binding protein Ku
MATLWRGFLRLSLVSCPVTLSPAISETTRIHLNQLNKATRNRLRVKMVDEETGEPVERDDIVKGYRIEKGHLLLPVKGGKEHAHPARRKARKQA